ncbi:conserved protein of unknown function [Candidatus Filomicrobium marinum]|uniref:FAD assembly factor SdhE n=1 Tax=Candidatus Filomicrobium marinum TaxID=1608628 RepID=A0A0D6JIQ1_9HYPH|nr:MULTISPECIES: succinate dehydrogenase assembly factor 2 [Filomicrobium]MCV0371409.1 succinate dehydrogenase assembly factor 2 [Filomicrobium sp.]CFX35229.1 conserved protein of unknown function [Candidatus Filomicrobium marinum]CPR21816.1 conserved protein of unknown function [Candidatus Filomicrobium marinum]
MDESLDIRRRRALYRANHRGTKEMDLLMGRYAEAHLEAMDEAALDSFERFLALADPDVQSWILSASDADRRTPIEPEFADLIQSLRSFHGLS